MNQGTLDIEEIGETRIKSFSNGFFEYVMTFLIHSVFNMFQAKSSFSNANKTKIT